MTCNWPWMSACCWLAMAVACIDEPCKRDQAYQNGRCVDVLPKVDAGPPAVGGADASAVDAQAPDAQAPARYSGFGDVCRDDVTHRDCTQDADYCGKVQPTDATGQCTKIDCLEAPSLCPPTWSCYDIQAIVPTSKVKSACIPPFDAGM